MHSLGDNPLAFAMRSDGESEQPSQRSEPGVVPLSSLLLPLIPSSLTSPLHTQYTYNTFCLHYRYDKVATSLELPSVSLDAPS